MTQTKYPKYGPVEGDPWVDWRFVVYTCYRPQKDLEKKRKRHAERLQKCFEETRVTNHWGTRLFPKKRFPDSTKRESTLEPLVENPTKVRKVVGEPSSDVKARLMPLITMK